MKDVIIIGAGLSGLTTAYELKKQGLRPLVLEARSRYGGRIWTVEGEGRGTPMELGATWFGDKHQYLRWLMEELEVDYFNQFTRGIALLESMSFAPAQQFKVPDSEEPYHRIMGGSQALIQALVEQVGEAHIQLDTPVVEIKDKGAHLLLRTAGGESLEARKVVAALPPRLLLKKIHFSPALPKKLAGIMASTHTWMSDSIKFAVEYERPFWREHGFSGTLYSQAGPATEGYDHTNYEETAYALKGFLAPGTSAIKPDARREMVLRQLVKLFGLEAADFLSYRDWDWAKEAFTHLPYEGYILPHQNSGHPAFAEPQMGGKLILSGTETSSEFGGYMDGAVCSGRAAARRCGQGMINV